MRFNFAKLLDLNITLFHAQPLAERELIVIQSSPNIPYICKRRSAPFFVIRWITPTCLTQIVIVTGKLKERVEF